MKKIILVFVLFFCVLSVCDAQSVRLERTWAPVLMSWRADTLWGADTNFVMFQAPLGIYLQSMQVVSDVADTADFKLQRISSSTTAIDSVIMLSHGKQGTTKTVYYNNMNATLVDGAQYRIGYFPRHTGGASHTLPVGVTVILLGQLIY